MSYSYNDSEMKRLPYLTTKPDVPSNATELNTHTRRICWSVAPCVLMRQRKRRKASHLYVLTQQH